MVENGWMVLFTDGTELPIYAYREGGSCMSVYYHYKHKPTDKHTQIRMKLIPLDKIKWIELGEV